MAADYAGAIAAIKTRLLAATLPLDITAIGFVNETDPVRADSDGIPWPWAEFEVVSLGSDQLGFGVDGNNVIVYDGAIKAYVYTKVGTGTDAGLAVAIALGNIFKNVDFYTGVTDGCFVRTDFPSITDGNTASDDGLWFGVTVSIPFQYWHRG